LLEQWDRWPGRFLEHLVEQALAMLVVRNLNDDLAAGGSGVDGAIGVADCLQREMPRIHRRHHLICLDEARGLFANRAVVARPSPVTSGKGVKIPE
jgi:hypothetical protein